MENKKRKNKYKAFNFKDLLANLPSKRLWLTGFFIVLCSALLLICVSFLLLKSNQSGELSYNLDKSIEKIRISLPAGHLYLQSWQKDYVKVAFEFYKNNSSKRQFKVSEKDKTWHFDWQRTFVISDWRMDQLPTFRFFIPESQIKKLEFKLNYGVIDLAHFKDCLINGYLNMGELNIEEQLKSQGLCQVGWGDIYVYKAVEDLTWQKSTGFSALLKTGSDKSLKLVTYMGGIKLGEIK